MRFAWLILAALPMAAATDVSGKWTLNGDVMGNPIPMSCSFKQDAAAKVSGKCSANGEEVEVAAGKIDGQAITFSVTLSGYELTYNGSVEADSMKGDIAVAGVTGTFSGKREAN